MKGQASDKAALVGAIKFLERNGTLPEVIAALIILNRQRQEAKQSKQLAEYYTNEHAHGTKMRVVGQSETVVYNTVFVHVRGKVPSSSLCTNYRSVFTAIARYREVGGDHPAGVVSLHVLRTVACFVPT